MEEIKEIISSGINSFIEINETGFEYIGEEDFEDMKDHVVVLCKEIINEKINNILLKGHGGGNWRRLLELSKEKI